ncbi:glycosyltransferase [Telmatospirillum siberiense]|nr:glycosyltransferase [Telmatospirillum siberiense]
MFPSRAAVLDVGLKCTHSCRFCYYSFLDGSTDQFSGMRHAKFREGAALRDVLTQLKASGFLAFDITGGEPTLHPDIIDLIRYAEVDLGMSARLITLGQFLMKKHRNGKRDRLIEDLLDAQLTNFLFSCHAVDETLFQHLTGGSWLVQRDAMNLLDEKGIQYTSNTTVCADNYSHLPDLAREILKHNVYLHNFIAMNAYHYWSKEGRAAGVQAGYVEMGHYLREAVAILEEGGVAVNIRYAPLCTMAGVEKNVVGVVGVRYDPYEWMNAVNHQSPVPTTDGQRLPLQGGQIERVFGLVEKKEVVNGVKLIAARGIPGHPDGFNKLFSAECGSCSALNVCDGFAPSYLFQHGTMDAVPYIGSSRGDLLDNARMAYTAPFFVKRRQGADMKSVVRRALHPQPIGANPKVSIIVTCYNYERYLAGALESALKQTYENLQVILVDDGSTDDSLAVAMTYGIRYPEKLTVIRQDNSGQPAIARNKGIERSDGELILCLDADDLLAPTMVEECVDWMRRHPETSIVYPCMHDFGIKEGIYDAKPYSFPMLLLGNFLPYCSLYKREVWETVGGYRTNVRGCEDYDFWVAAGGLGYFGKQIPRVLFHYRNHQEGIYLTDVKPNYPEKFRQIILNNSDLYPPSMVRQAKSGEPIALVVS